MKVILLVQKRVRVKGKKMETRKRIGNESDFACPKESKSEVRENRYKEETRK